MGFWRFDLGGLVFGAALAILSTGPGLAQTPFWSPGLDAPVPLAAGVFFAAVRAADIVLVGERHDNAHHHAAQATIVREVASDGNAVIVVFEMLDRDQQASIETYLSAGGGAAGFAAAVSWRERGWPDAALYRPLFNAVFDVDAAIAAADLPRSVIRRVSRQGNAAVPAALNDRFGLHRNLDPTVDAQMRQIQRDAHCGLLPQAALSPMVAVQRLRDAAFADAIVEALRAAPNSRVVLIAGAGHVRNDHGVGALLHKALPDARLLTIGLVEASPQSTQDTGGAFDVVWTTPPAVRPDQCEQLRLQLAR